MVFCICFMALSGLFSHIFVKLSLWCLTSSVLLNLESVKAQIQLRLYSVKDTFKITVKTHQRTDSIRNYHVKCNFYHYDKFSCYFWSSEDFLFNILATHCRMKGVRLWEFGDNWHTSWIDVTHLLELLMPADIRRDIHMKCKYKYKYHLILDLDRLVSKMFFWGIRS